MGSMLSSQKTQKSKEEMETALDKAKQIVSSSPVVVFRYLILFPSNLVIYLLPIAIYFASNMISLIKSQF